MKTEIAMDQAIGKTLAGAVMSYTSGQAVMVFTDGTFTTLSIDYDHDGDGTIGGGELRLFEFGDDRLVSAGVITQAEIEERRQARNAKAATERAASDRLHYERLRARFEAKEQAPHDDH